MGRTRTYAWIWVLATALSSGCATKDQDESDGSLADGNADDGAADEGPPEGLGNGIDSGCEILDIADVSITSDHEHVLAPLAGATEYVVTSERTSDQEFVELRLVLDLGNRSGHDLYRA